MLNSLPKKHLTSGLKTGLKIGQVALATGLPVRTVRYYESLGLLDPTVRRSAAGYRLFDAAVVGRLSFIRRCQQLGLSLEEIRELLQVHDQGQLPCQEIQLRLQEKVKQIEQRIADLLLLKEQIQRLLSHWHIPEGSLAERASTAAVICPILQDSSGEEPVTPETVGQRYSTVTDLAKLRG